MASTAFQLVMKADLAPWPTVAVMLALVSYSWVGLPKASNAGFAATVEQSVLVAGVLVLVIAACSRRRTRQCS
ncbi:MULTISPECIES: hypothetical protein [Amycolatopsis]|uniref:Uncharacterized protein n=1 Tax=Amycolatopsis dendrobii TaxID=2760662 RepID=A0A7W3ZC35_9PSEU|nr:MULTISPECIES: hypothetical protein [Amycolatopsis]MBB1155895.1 hypothetical protein [Amycolatopsis dendrobii]UKD53094.1 hypothetical protein L3Q65_35105 [Amycolatopsis sp. FU40]